MNAEELQARFELAQVLAVEAGRGTLELFNRFPSAFERKADGSPVTEADRAAERLIRERIQQRWPEDSILGEEEGESKGTSDWQWILDPIDGTKSFITGVPLYGTMVAVLHLHEPVIGAVYCPALSEGVFAAKGLGARWLRAGEDQPARVGSRRVLSESVVLTSELSSFAGRGENDLVHRLESQSYFMRTWGDCYGYLLVATGRADVMLDPQLSIWDAAALLPILSESGGVFCDWQGEPAIDSGNALACNHELLPQVLAILNSDPTHR